MSGSEVDDLEPLLLPAVPQRYKAIDGPRFVLGRFMRVLDLCLNFRAGPRGLSVVGSLVLQTELACSCRLESNFTSARIGATASTVTF